MRIFNSRHRQILAGGTLLMFFTMLVSCQKELVRWPYYLQTRYKVIFDWADAPKANPLAMHFIAYPKGGGQGLEYDFTNKTGGEIDLAAGEYQSLAFNSGTKNLRYRGDSWETFEIYTPETSLADYSELFSASRSVPRTAGSDNQPVIMEPDMLWTASAAEMPTAGDNEAESVTLRMQPSVFTYRFVINNVANLAYVTDITATLSGMSGSMFPSTGKATDTHCIIPVTVKSDGKQTITCTVRSFGHCPQKQVIGHHLVVYALLSDGSKWYYDFDVTGELHEPAQTETDEDGNVLIVINLEELNFPTPIDESVSVEDWRDGSGSDEEFRIIM